MLSACIVICASFGLIQTVPLNFRDTFFPNYDNVDYYNGMVRATRNLLPETDSETVFLKPLEVNSAKEAREGNDFIKLPTLSSDDLVMLDPLPRSSYFDHGIQAALPLEYGLITPNGPSPIVWNNKYLRTPYEIDQDTFNEDLALNTRSVNLELDPYEVDLYPVVHTSIAAALNPVPAVHTLPPVYATHIHEAVPTLETNADYDIDVLNPENSEQMPPNLRITRSRRDFLDDLEHDAMLNNLLPTMPVPFVRGAEGSYQEPQPAQPTGPIMAVYPASAIRDCAIPILLRCTPNVIRGVLSSTYAEHSSQAASGAAYRDNVRQNNQNVFSEIN